MYAVQIFKCSAFSECISDLVGTTRDRLFDFLNNLEKPEENVGKPEKCTAIMIIIMNIITRNIFR